MKIGFDGKRAAQNRTGLGNYSRFVISGLVDFVAGNEYLLYVPSVKRTVSLGRLSQVAKICSPNGIWRRLSSLWRVWGITNDIRKDELSLFHGLSNELPLNICKAKKTKSIVTIHDLIFLRYPAYYHFIDRKIYAYKFRRACQLADRVIAVSECTKRDIISYFKIEEEKIEVVYQGCDKLFSQVAPEDIKKEVKQKYQLPERYILYVGSIEARKNLLLVAKALKHLQDPISVIAIGRRTPYAKQVEDYLQENRLESRMKLLSNIPFRELPAFYQMATVFVYPSFFEGFGIPLLEALNSGVPVIGATGSCLEEAGGPSSLYVDPDDAVGLGKVIEQVLEDKQLRDSMIADGRKYALRFDESKLTTDVIKVYNKTMGL